ncbi:MAG: 50S ribosomal protein L4 [Armatimonadetes bacterium]|nr:50S ribosomal protein L4 [Armatimonadota bacterium]MDE2206884.1 50S ribosomal protein L4 [Armatimonadota bacterium]
MPSISLYNQAGKEAGTLDLPEAVFGVDWNEALVHQAMVAEAANRRQGTASTKTRSQVRGGGRKPWRQKGTGRARQGTIRAPHWRGGGVVGGPVPRSYRKALPVKMRRGALRCILSARVAAGDVIGLDQWKLDSPTPKTRAARAVIQNLELDGYSRILVIIPELDRVLWRSTRNLPNVHLRYGNEFSVSDVLFARKIVLLSGAVARIQSAWEPAPAAEAAA